MKHRILSYFLLKNISISFLIKLVIHYAHLAIKSCKWRSSNLDSKWIPCSFLISPVLNLICENSTKIRNIFWSESERFFSFVFNMRWRGAWYFRYSSFLFIYSQKRAAFRHDSLKRIIPDSCNARSWFHKIIVQLINFRYQILDDTPRNPRNHCLNSLVDISKFLIGKWI